MTFVEAVQSGFANYVNFNGRARRSEFWWWALFQVVALFVAGFVAGLIHISLLSTLAVLALFLPSLAVQARRLHDTGRSGWWVLLALVPVVGIIVLIVWWCMAGTPGVNRFGADPVNGGALAPSMSPIRP